MTRSFQGSPKEWKRISSPLEMLDPVLEDFADKHELPLTLNTGHWPNRELTWTFRIERSIQIYLEDDKNLTWSLAVSAHQFFNSLHMTKKKLILEKVSIQEMHANLPEKLEEAYTCVTNWNVGHLGTG